MPSTTMASTGGGDPSDFEGFFQRWMGRQEQILDQLVMARESSSQAHENDLRNLINRVRAHYQEYYEEKSRMTNINVFLMFSPAWFTPFERTFLWISGFKPGLACRLATTAVDDLTEDQIQRIRQLNHETKGQEKLLNDEMAKIQESLAAPPLMHSAKLAAERVGNLEREEVDEMTEPLIVSMQNVLNEADRLRTRTADRVIAILSPVQNVRFLAAAAELQMKLRVVGLQKEAERAYDGVINGW